MTEGQRPQLTLMCGVSGSGKTTFAKEYAKQNNLLYLCPDDFYGAFHGDDRIHTHGFEVWISFFQAIHIAETSGRSCIIDTNAPTMVDRVQFLNWFPGFDQRVICILTPPDICLQRNRSRRRVIPEETMQKMIGNFQIPFPEEDERWRSIRYFRSVTGRPFDEVDQEYARFFRTLYKN